MNIYSAGRKLVGAALGIFVLNLNLSTLHAQNKFQQTNLVSDIPALAAQTDPNLVNPWGIAFSSTSPFWISDNGTGLSTLYNGSGTPQALVVTVPPPAGGTPPAAPTGVVFNGGTGFGLTGPNNPARFIFATEDGTISGWNPSANATNAILKVDNSGSGAVYKGLAIGNSASGDVLYAANFHAGRIDVFNNQFAPINLAGSFTDPVLPAGFAPFNVQNIGGQLFVTYAKQDGSGMDDVAGPGNGFVDKFDLNGNFIMRLASNGALNSPWGLALAPAGFGPFGGDLLVGNFGDGKINAYNPISGALIAALNDVNGNPIINQGLWGLSFGNGGSGGQPNVLYFTAGVPGNGNVEDHGLFGSISAVPEPATWVTGFALSGVCLAGWLRRR